MRISKKAGNSVKTMITEKMQLLDDFGICRKDDAQMRRNLENAVRDNPDRDPQAVLDSYCRPLLHKKMDSWT